MSTPTDIKRKMYRANEPRPVDPAAKSPVRISASSNGEKQEMQDLFEIDGKMYQIPVKPRLNLALRYLFQVKTLGDVVASANLMESLIGTEGFIALTECDDLTEAQFRQILDLAAEHTMGAIAQSMGNSESELAR
jgi:hypothetical protein